jgi:anti-sigma-K factor RskA
MNSPDIHTLTGAYALDALDEFERRQFQAHLDLCPDCTQEVEGFRATATKLGVAAAQQPPRTLRHTVMTQVAVTRQHSPTAPSTTQTWSPTGIGRPGWRMRWTASAAALATAAAVVLGVVSVHTARERDTTKAALALVQAQYTPVAQLIAAPDVKGGSGPGVRSGTGFVLASHQLNKAVLLVSGLPAPPGGRTYQVWLIGHGHPRSVGLIRAGTSTPDPPLRFGDLTGAAKVGLTIEPAGGSPQPTTTPVVLFDLPT